jgi:tripartite-type tricarboxylate transporter receptor subunit TctC
MLGFSRTGTALAAMLAAMMTAAPLTAAQDRYPSRPVKIILPIPAGTSPDIRLRIVADQITRTWGQQVVVENRPGGALAVGVRAALSAPADGYTLLAAPAAVFTILPVQKGKPPLDVKHDFVPIGLVFHEGMLIAVSAKLGVKTLADLLAMAKREPGKIVIGTPGAGTLPQLAARLLGERANAPLTVLPYSTGGASGAIADVLGGRVHAVMEGRAALKGALDSGDLKAIAATSDERPANAPDLPTVSETVPGLAMFAFMALVAPKGTPEGIVHRVGEDLRKAFDDPETRARLEPISTPFRPMSSAELVRFIEAEQALWWPVVKQSLGAK